MSGHGKICLITGATDGVGKATAMSLASRGFTIVLAARNARKAEAVAKEIAHSTGNPEVDVIVADLASLASIGGLVEAFRGRYARLDVLINNAGVFLPKRTITRDGFETTYQVNYLAHFLLTHLLLEHLKNSSQGRIINLSSSVYTQGKFDPRNLQSERAFSMLGTYAASKLEMLMFTRELASRVSGTSVTANAAHPGVVRTPMMLKAPGPLRIASYLALPFSVSPERGARTSVYLASSTEVSNISGRYFVNARERSTRNSFDTEGNRALLWEISLSAVRQHLPAAAHAVD